VTFRAYRAKPELSLSTATSYYVQRTRGFSPISVEIQNSTQAWKLIEQDYTLRLSLVAPEWATEHLRAWNAVFAEGRRRGNTGYYGPALVEMEIANADKRAEWAYRTCCEIWEIQGRTKSRVFYRAVFESCLQTMFSVREGCFKSALERYRKGTLARIPQSLSAIGGHMKREMDRLRAKWNTKLEIDTRNEEYRQAGIGPTKLLDGHTLTGLVPTPALTDTRELPQRQNWDNPPHSNYTVMPLKQIHAIAFSFTWRELETRFREIQGKPSEQKKVSAEFTRTEWDSGTVSEEWNIRGDSVCRREFERLATIAARKLGHAGIENASNSWLDRIHRWLQWAGLDKDRNVTWCPTGSGCDEKGNYKTSHLTTGRIAELSAMLCVELMAQGVPESGVAPHAIDAKTDDSQSKSASINRKTRKTKSELFKTAVIFGAIQLGLKGPKYCAALDSRRLKPREDWKDEGCPVTYALAYKNATWRKRIQDEKHRFQKRYDETPAGKLEAIIQGENSTRQTRR
jgi:hypothetical protein